MQVFAQVLIGN